MCFTWKKLFINFVVPSSLNFLKGKCSELELHLQSLLQKCFPDKKGKITRKKNYAVHIEIGTLSNIEF